MSTFAIYPCHMNAALSHKHGRKYNKKLCTSNPTIQEMEKAAAALGLQFTLEDKKTHPKTPLDPGRIRFSKEYGRLTVIRGLKQEIEELRIVKVEKEIAKKENVKAKIGTTVFMPRTKKKKDEKKSKKNK
ncbi:hypothetical protein VCUG_02334 [Vavraia culicis subsp. floridensis]|uniref:SRP19 protein n=1 Tax=Vavraia culicis (isolate floridensis) TaxID=948595 RepID=L2GST9_VAVCU|nr:uncharacterized protein VCUG_02334 [Vavraia culicis subsp. floridensis]ELA46165.1 hypothetical protein VCUG_02334 [Vavraia culicis subsp. floridensis]